MGIYRKASLRAEFHPWMYAGRRVAFGSLALRKRTNHALLRLGRYMCTGKLPSGTQGAAPMIGNTDHAAESSANVSTSNAIPEERSELSVNAKRKIFYLLH